MTKDSVHGESDELPLLSIESLNDRKVILSFSFVHAETVIVIVAIQERVPLR